MPGVKNSALRFAPCEASGQNRNILIPTITILTTMANKYIPDELITKIGMLGLDVQTFIKEAIDEKLQRLGEED